MNHWRGLVAVVSCILLTAGNAYAGGKIPKRKSGLWQVSMTNSASQGHTMVMQQCIDENTDNLMQQRAERMSKQECSQQDFRQEGSRWVINSVCVSNGRTMTTKGVFSGDFGSNYQGNLHTTYDPPMHGMKESDTKMQGKWLGACKPGQKPGDVTMEGMPAGMPRINIQNMFK